MDLERKVVVLGGYGNFGKRIVENLATIANTRIFVAGRSESKALLCIQSLEAGFTANLEPLEIDISASDFQEKLQSVSPFLVIHTGGPFQEQDYHVAKICIQLGAHYIDLADDRRFVCDIGELDKPALDKGVTIISGASSVPGLSSTVVESYQDQFELLESIDLAIAPGNKAERGLATVKAILSYTGHPLKVFKEGRWQNAYGWMDSQKVDFKGIVGKRRLANVDVPDLELFPKKYGVSKRVSFQAGLELPVLHLTMVFMAFMAKLGVVKNWEPLSKLIVRTSNIFLSLGTDKGAMRVSIKGQSNNKHREVVWTLYAPDGKGPYIPTLSTIILARKLLETDSPQVAINPGARSCVGLFELSDFIPYFDDLGIFFEEQVRESIKD